MKKFLFVAILLIVPAFAHAAFDDVTLETTALLDVGAYTLAVSGSSATVESITVGETTFSVTLQNGSSLTVLSTDRVDFSYDVSAQTTTETCTDTESTLTLSVASAGATTVTVTPSGTCTPAAPAEEESGGGGGGSSRKRQVVPDPLPVDNEAQIRALQQKIIELLQQIIAILLAQRGN